MVIILVESLTVLNNKQIWSNFKFVVLKDQSYKVTALYYVCFIPNVKTFWTPLVNTLITWNQCSGREWPSRQASDSRVKFLSWSPDRRNFHYYIIVTNGVILIIVHLHVYYLFIMFIVLYYLMQVTPINDFEAQFCRAKN